MMSDDSIYRSQPYYALALDPLHVGAGGYRLGRVDLSIIREPGDNLPKIPGSSLLGVSRACTAMRTDHYQCAGKGGGDGSGHCCSPDCPVCVSFGFSNGHTHQSLQGMAQFSDARLVFFPVYSMVGPVWVTSPGVLRQAGMSNPPQVSNEQVRLAATLHPTPNQRLTRLNLGWLLLSVEDDLDVDGIVQGLPAFPVQAAPLQEIRGRLVLLSDELFSKVVNDNLEVRTSVSIDPATGAADDKALFTYEALPRTTLLYFEVLYNNPQHFQIGGKAIAHDIDWVQQNVKRGLTLLRHLGIGGMNTRGMGRLQVLGLEEE